jgi:hypothetical protein
MAAREAAELPIRWLREPKRLVFPASELVPETRRHLGLRTALFQLIEAAFADRATLGSEQFVYWDPTDPKACCAPDVMVRMGVPDAPFDSWKVWERGAPHLAVEIASASDVEDRPWSQKLERYRKMGVQELVRFDADAETTALRIWDFVDGDLVERDAATAGFHRCRTMDAYFCVRNDPKLGPMLRLAEDSDGCKLYPTPDEAREAADEAREAADEAREAAERRVRELEAELARRR